MKKVMIYAYTKYNLGDDLFIKVLSERYPRVNFVLFAPKEYKKLFYNVTNLTIFPSDTFFVRGFNFVLRNFKKQNSFRRLLAKSCDASVYVGGSLFIQGENWEQGIQDVKNMRIENKPFFLLGANFGPFVNKDFFLEYKKIFKNYTDICFRERNTFEMFKDLSNVRMADDIIFQLKHKPTNRVKKQENNIVVSVIKPSRKNLKEYDDIYYKKIKEMAIYFMENGYKITLMSFCEYEGDKEAVEEIFDLIPENHKINVTKFFYKLNIDEALKQIEESSFVVATRFHSMILGWIYSKPVFPIAYSNKMTNVMEDVGFKGGYTDFGNIESLKPEEVLACMKNKVLDISKQIENAEEHFEKLNIYLSEEDTYGSVN